jgi:hypothetical protein
LTKGLNDYIFYISANPCKIDQQIGPCNGPFQTKYYYDQVTKQCKAFQWGGCQPNANNFPTLAACRRQCPSTIGTYKNKYTVVPELFCAIRHDMF